MKTASGIQIGWASRKLNFPKPVQLQGQMYERLSTGERDPLTVTALALDGGPDGDSTVLVSADLCWIPSEILASARERLRVAIPFDPIRVVAFATHTHTGPVMSPDASYPPPPEGVMVPSETAEIIAATIAEAAAEAWRARKTGAVSWGYGYAVVGHNRRVSYFDGTTKMYGATNDPGFSHIEGDSDHGVNGLFTYDAEIKLTGMIVNIPCPSQVTGGYDFISADFWSEAREEIRKRHGANLFILPQCSAAGDQSPTPIMNGATEKRMLRAKGLLHDEQPDFWIALRRELANRIAAAVDEMLPLAAKDIREDVAPRHSVNVLSLPARPVTEADRLILEERIAKVSAEADAFDPVTRKGNQAYTCREYLRAALRRFDADGNAKVIAVETHVIRLGDIAFVTFPYELYVDYGRRIQGRSPATQTFVVQLAGPAFYVPTERATRRGSYGADAASVPVTPEGGQMIVDNAVATLKNLFAQA